jgi:hypothetical protein
MKGESVVLCLETVAVSRLAGVNRSTLDYWVRTGLVSPSVRSSPGRRRTRLWSVEDAVIVRTIAALRAAGCPLQQVRRARDVVSATWGSFGADTTLVWTGNDVVRVGPEGDVESLLVRPRQQAFRAVALPLAVWRGEADGEALEIPSNRVLNGVPQRRVVGGS